MNDRELHMGWLTDEEFVDYVVPRTAPGDAMHARLTRLVYEGMAREADLEERLNMAKDEITRLERDVAALMEG